MPSFLSFPRGRYTRRMLALVSVAAVTAGFVVAAKAQPATAPDLGATMPPIPSDATVSVGYSTKDVPQR